MKHTFGTFLERLEVKHTRPYSDQHFNGHPHKYNLFGLSKMFSFSVFGLLAIFAYISQAYYINVGGWSQIGFGYFIKCSLVVKKAGYLKWHRLYFMTAVVLPFRDAAVKSHPEGDNGCKVHTTAGVKSGKKITLVCENRNNPGLRLLFCLIAANRETSTTALAIRCNRCIIFFCASCLHRDSSGITAYRNGVEAWMTGNHSSLCGQVKKKSLTL